MVKRSTNDGIQLSSMKLSWDRDLSAVNDCHGQKLVKKVFTMMKIGKID